MQEKESEVRRRRLWEENRRRQRNTGMITPAIHPRYGRLYRELYPDGLEQSAGNGAEDLDKKENSRVPGSSGAGTLNCNLRADPGRVQPLCSSGSVYGNG